MSETPSAPGDSHPDRVPPARPDPALSEAVVAAERHVASFGWDQPARLYALVADTDLREREPDLATRLGVHGEGYTAVEQDGFDVSAGLDTALAHLAWPAEVAGTALVHEVLVLPPDAEAQAPDDGDPVALEAWVAQHADRREVRLAVGVLRDGQQFTVLRLRPPAGAGPAAANPSIARGAAEDGAPGGGGDDELLTGPDLAPGLAAALRATLT